MIRWPHAATGLCPNYILLGMTTYLHGVHRVSHQIRAGRA